MFHRLRELVAVFGKLGVLGFGGPAALIAMMDEEVVGRRQWLTRERFLDLVGATNLIPGPNATEMAIHIGYVRAGWAGLIVAGASLIVPAALITGIFAWAYVRYGSLPRVAPLLYGIQPAVLAVIVAALGRLGRTAVKSWRLATIGLAVTLVSIEGANEVLALFAGGILGMAWLRMADRGRPEDPTPHEQRAGRSLSPRAAAKPRHALECGKVAEGIAAIPSATLARRRLSSPRGSARVRRAAVGVATVGTATSSSAAAATLAAAAAGGAVALSLWRLGLFFLKIGAVLYGSGYVLVAFLEGGLVHDCGWLTQRQLLDAVAAGQITPGPLLSTATFVGYVLLGVPGAVVATVAIFLPSFVFVAALNPLIPRLRESAWMGAFLDAVNISSMGLMAAVTLRLGQASLTAWPAWAIALAAAGVGLRWKVNPAWLVVGGAAAGWLLTPWT